MVGKWLNGAQVRVGEARSGRGGKAMALIKCGYRATVGAPCDKLTQPTPIDDLGLDAALRHVPCVDHRQRPADRATPQRQRP